MSRNVVPWGGALLAALVGCQHTGNFVWADAYQDPPILRAGAYVVSAGDLISVRVFGQDGMSARVRVRADGKISLPFLGDVPVAGVEPIALAGRIQEKLKEFIVNPVVTVTLEEEAPLEISIVGEVTRPGTYKLESGASVLNALAAAGGLTEYASRDRLFVLRLDQKNDARAGTVRIRMTYDALSRAQGRAVGLRLRRGDVVVVE